MICRKCNKNFSERNIEESHDVPCYLWYNLIYRKDRKARADKLGRHNLCKECHKKYEQSLNLFLKSNSLRFAKRWFNDD